MLCLDIGSHSIKLCDLADDGLGWQLRHLARLPLAPGLVRDGVITDAAAVAEPLRRRVDTAGLRGQPVALTISSPTGNVHHLQVPDMTDDELVENMAWEADTLVPHHMNDVYLGWRIARKTDRGHDIELSWELREVIDPAIELVRRAQLSVERVCVGAAALAGWYRRDRRAPDAVLVDIGAAATTVVSIAGRCVVATARVAAGGEDITGAVQRRLNSDRDVAEQTKLAAFVDVVEQQAGPYRGSDTSAVVRATVKQAAAALADELSGPIARACASGAPNRIWLSGSSAAIPDVATALRGRFECPVDQWLPYNGLRPGNTANGATLLQLGAQFGIAFGLASADHGLRVPGLGRSRWWHFWKR